MKRIGGMFANLPTPFSRDGSRIDFAVVRERIEWLVEAGIHGFSTQLSAGEFAYLGLDERGRSPGSSWRPSLRGRRGEACASAARSRRARVRRAKRGVRVATEQKVGFSSLRRE